MNLSSIVLFLQIDIYSYYYIVVHFPYHLGATLVSYSPTCLLYLAYPSRPKCFRGIIFDMLFIGAFVLNENLLIILV